MDVLDLATHGHPLTGTYNPHTRNPQANVFYSLGDVEVRVPSSTPKSGMEVSDTHAELSTKPGECDFIRAKYDIGVGISYPVETKLKHPIHESIAIAAFINSNIPFPRGTFYNNINDKQWEYFRGLLWNDDPSCLLFLDDAEDSRLFGLGIEWLDEYKFGDDSCMTRRSHLGNLQFLHGMGSYEGEDPIETRQRLLDWLQIMYKLACGDQGVSEDGHLKKHFPQHFGKDTTPSKHDTLRDLLLATTPGYARANIKQRALGSCLHIIADSFALGHTHRRLRNPLDLAEQEEDRYIRFRPGTYGDWGPVLCFHTYSSQDSDRHSHYDSRAGDEDPSPRDLTTFNEIVGARNAIQASTTLINFFARKTRWEEGVSDFLENCVFELDKDSRPSNHFVDEDVIDEIYRTRMVKVDTKYNEVYPGNFRKQRDGHDEELGWEQKCGRAGNYYLDVVALFFVMACFSTYFLYRIA